MNATHVVRGRVAIPAFKKVPTQDGLGFMSVEDGTKEADVVLEVDTTAILRYYGGRALRSKGKKATACGGDIRVRVVGTIEHVPERK